MRKNLTQDKLRAIALLDRYRRDFCGKYSIYSQYGRLVEPFKVQAYGKRLDAEQAGYFDVVSITVRQPSSIEFAYEC